MPCNQLYASEHCDNDKDRKDCHQEHRKYPQETELKGAYMRLFKCPKCNSEVYRVIKGNGFFRLISKCGYWFEITTKFKIAEKETPKEFMDNSHCVLCAGKLIKTVEDFKGNKVDAYKCQKCGESYLEPIATERILEENKNGK